MVIHPSASPYPKSPTREREKGESPGVKLREREPLGRKRKWGLGGKGKQSFLLTGLANMKLGLGGGGGFGGTNWEEIKREIQGRRRK